MTETQCYVFFCCWLFFKNKKKWKYFQPLFIRGIEIYQTGQVMQLWNHTWNVQELFSRDFFVVEENAPAL